MTRKAISKPVKVSFIEWTGKNYYEVCEFACSDSIEKYEDINGEVFLGLSNTGITRNILTIGDVLVYDDVGGYCIYSADNFKQTYAALPDDGCDSEEHC